MTDPPKDVPATPADEAPLVVERDGTRLAGSLWLPRDEPVALLVMHPGSGPSDRHNDVFFPPVRSALLDAGVAVASFDKRGVGGSTGSWQEVGISGQAEDLLACLAAARAVVPGVTAGVFGHSQGGWVVLEAARIASHGGRAGPDFVVQSSGPAVTPAEQERYSVGSSLARRALPPAVRAGATASFDVLASLAESDDATYDDWVTWTRAHPTDHAAFVDVFGDAFPSQEMWHGFRLVAAHDPADGLRSLAVPLLAVLGADDRVVPVTRTVEVLGELVDPGLLTVVVVPGGDHRLQRGEPAEFAAGYPDVVVDFVLARARDVPEIR